MTPIDDELVVDPDGEPSLLASLPARPTPARRSSPCLPRLAFARRKSVPNALSKLPREETFLVDLAVLSLIGMGVTHLIHVSHELEESTWVGVAFIGISAACGALVVLIRRLWWWPPLWMATGSLAAGTMAGYVLSRVVPLPGLAGHVGQWLDVPGALSVAFEATLVALSVRALRSVTPLARANLLSLGLVSIAGLGALTGFPEAQAHNHGAGHGAGHDHAGGHDHGASVGSSAHFDPSQPNLPDLERAGPRAVAEADRLLAASKAAARTRFPTYDAALKAGYRMHAGERGRVVSNGYFFHLTNPRDEWGGRDDRTLDPLHPESLVYWMRPNGRIFLVALMFRSPQIPPYASSILRWHKHNPKYGAMTHLWLTDDLRSAYAQREPKRALERALGLRTEDNEVRITRLLR